MSDDDAISGEQGGYVPCDDAPLAQPTPDDTSAVWGEDEGRVPADQSALAVTAPDDSAAVYGSSGGYVAKPCVCFETVCSATEIGHDLFTRTVNTNNATGWQGFGDTNTTGLTWRAEGVNEADPRCDGADAIMSFTGVGFFGNGLGQCWLATSASSNNSAKYRTIVATGGAYHWKVENLRVSDADVSVILDGASSPQGWYWWVGTDGNTLTGTPTMAFSYYIRVGSESGGTWSLYKTPFGGGIGTGTIVASGSFASGGDLDVEVLDNGATLSINGTGVSMPTTLHEAFVEFDLAGALGHTATGRIAALYHLGPTVCEEVEIPCP